jgi:hypothetical protein
MTRATERWTALWSRLLPRQRRRRRHDSYRILESMTPHQLADLPALHEPG